MYKHVFLLRAISCFGVELLFAIRQRTSTRRKEELDKCHGAVEELTRHDNQTLRVRMHTTKVNATRTGKKMDYLTGKQKESYT